VIAVRFEYHFTPQTIVMSFLLLPVIQYMFRQVCGYHRLRLSSVLSSEYEMGSGLATDRQVSLISWTTEARVFC